MIVHNGTDSLKLQISRIDSVTFDGGDTYSNFDNLNWGKNIAGEALYENFNYVKIGTYTHPSAQPYYDFYIEGKTLWAVTKSGIRKLDWSDPSNLVLLKENEPFISNTNLQGRSIACKGKNLYVGYRVSYSNYVLDDAQITERFETKLTDVQSTINNNLSNNATINAFFQELSVTSRDLGKMHQIFLFKAYKRSAASYGNVICFKVSGESDFLMFSKNYPTREEALAALQDEYTNAAGDYCKVNWSALPEGNNSYSKVNFNFVAESYYAHTANADYTISDVCCPNSGNKSGLFSVKTINGDSAIINHKLTSTTKFAEVSFWIRIDQTFNGEVRIPLFKDGKGSDIYRLNVVSSGNSFVLDMDNSAGFKSFSNGVWYNIKATYHNGKKELYYRQKECSDWILLNSNTSSLADVSNVTIGIAATNADASIYFDDFRYSSCDIDGVSYDKGKITIIDKNTLEVKHTIHVEYPVTGMAVHGNRLVVSGLNGVNVYNIADAENPELVYSYRPASFRDIQEMKIYEHDGHVYAFICKYTCGVLILDITDLNNVFIAKEEEFSNWKYKNYSKAVYCYDVVIDWPYAYSTLAPLPAYSSNIPEACGVWVWDLTDLNNITRTMYMIEPSEITTNKNGDVAPTHIARYGNTLYLNNRDKGLAVFDIKSKGVVEYKGLVQFENETSVNCISITDDGYLFLGDDNTNGSCRNINVWKINE